jgi:hypothetical protein
LRSGKLRSEQKGPGNQSQRKKTMEPDYHRSEVLTACLPQCGYLRRPSDDLIQHAVSGAKAQRGVTAQRREVAKRART